MAAELLANKYTDQPPSDAGEVMCRRIGLKQDSDVPCLTGKHIQKRAGKLHVR